MSYQEFADRMNEWIDAEVLNLTTQIAGGGCATMEMYCGLTQARDAYLQCRAQVTEVLHAMIEFERYEGAKR